MPNRMIFLALLSTAATAVAGRAAERDAFLKQHCLDCHGPQFAEAGFRVDRLPGDVTGSDELAKWVRVYDRVRAGEMPPEEAAQPEATAQKTFLTALRKELVGVDRRLLAKGAAGTVRRLNRVEYEHTLRDLLALPRLNVRQSLPEDGRRHGFDKVAGALELSHVQMRKYLDVADRALRQAVVRRTSAPETVTWREPAARQNTGRAAIAIHAAAPLRDGRLAPELGSVVRGNPVDDPGNTYRAATFDGKADSLVVLSGRFGAHQPQGLQPDRFRPPIAGRYRVRFSTWGLRWNRGEDVGPAVRGTIRNHVEFGEPWTRDDEQRWKGAPLEETRVREFRENVEFYGETEATHVIRASLNGDVIGYFDAPSLEPTTHEFTVWLDPDDRVSFHVMSLPRTGPRNSASSNGVRSYEGPGVAFDWFEIAGPLLGQWPPERQRRLFGETPIGEFPRPLQDGLPTVEPGARVNLPVDSLAGAGQSVGDVWYLNVAGTASTKLNVAAGGRYELAVTASQTAAGDEAARMRLLVNGKPLPDARFTVDGTRSDPEVYRASFEVDGAGPVQVGVEFLNDFFDKETKADRNLLLGKIEVVAPEPDPKRQDGGPVETPDVADLLRDFAGRAFRRPVSAEELSPYVGIVEERLRDGAGFEDALLAGYRALLCAPDFLFVGLEDGGNAETDYALASRLSYFLWNSMPDAELRELAGRGELSRPEVLRDQVERMLDDPRSDRFVDHFLDEWLELRDIDFTTPDPQLYPEFDPWLRDSMLAETRAYFRKLLDDDRGVGHVVDSDFVLVDQRLAELYGIRGVNGGQLRPVKLPEDSPRGGFLAQAAVLKVTANGTATSPVLRGVWVMERLLGIPRDPPPPNVPAIEPDATGAVTIREMIEQHRAAPACAKCHAKFDPYGLALESFDVIGGRREKYRLAGRPRRIKVDGKKVLEPTVEVIGNRGRRVRLRVGADVDASGELADGRAFEDVNGLRELLLADRAALAENVARQLLIYATGSGVRFSDREEVASIVRRSGEAGYGLRSLLHEVVQSKVFRRTPRLAPRETN